MIHPEASIHPQALVEEGASIGARTRVWAFAHVLPGAVIGADCNLCDHTYVEGGARVGDRVTVKSGVYLWDGLTVADDVFLGPGAVFTNDLRPRSRAQFECAPTHIERGATVGANATVLPGLRLGRWCMVGAGSVVTTDVAPYTLVQGNPARVAGFVCRCGRRLTAENDTLRCSCGRTYQSADNELTCIEVV